MAWPREVPAVVAVVENANVEGSVLGVNRHPALNHPDPNLAGVEEEDAAVRVDVASASPLGSDNF